MDKEYVHFADWMGSYTDLSSPKKNYVVCEWANGAYGSLKDYDELFLRRLIIPEEPEWDIIRFVKHRWNPEETGAGLLLKATLTEEEKKLCPIVAVGLVAYYIKQFTLEGNRNIHDIFEKYYEKCLKWYEHKHRATPKGWKPILPNDFPVKHIKAELGNIEISKALLPYLQEDDAKHIEEIASNYIDFVKETIITPEKPAVNKENSGKKEGKPQSSKKTKDTTTATFTYSGFSEDNYSKQRLDLIVGALVGKFVAGNVNKNLIKDLFTGFEIGGKAKIIWKGTKGELVYFFRKLNEKNYISWPDGEFMWAIVASHFKIVTEYKNGKKREVSISADSLQFYTDTPKDDIKRQLDKIINMFEPDLTKLLGISPIDREEEAEKARHEELAREDFARQNKR